VSDQPPNEGPSIRTIIKYAAAFIGALVLDAWRMVFGGKR